MMSDKSRRDILALGAAFAGVAAANVAQAQTVHTVTIKGFAFEPETLTISAGDQVVFTNEDSAPHTATADNGAFDTGTLSRGQSATLTFGGAGTFTYFCAIHPSMKGSLTVA